MTKYFNVKFALKNLKNNKILVAPYIVATTTLITLFYILSSITTNEDISNLRGADALRKILSFGQVVTAIFILVFMFFTYSFILKKRTKEFGLYSVLGLKKKNIGKIILVETNFIAVITIVSGLLLGIIFDKLAYLSIIKLMDAEVKLGFSINTKAIIITCLLFLSIYLLLVVFSFVKVVRLKIINLLKDENKGEKEPKTSIVFVVVSLLAIGYAYKLSFSIIHPIKAVQTFFTSVILVIIGTYLLFTSVSILIFKILKNNKNYYYKTKNYIAISSLLFRIKRNAIGLANITILATMILVTLGATSALYFGKEDLVKSNMARDLVINIKSNSKQNSEQIKNEIDKIVLENKESKVEFIDYKHLALTGEKNSADNGINFTHPDYAQLSNVLTTIITTEEYYNKNNKKAINLSEDEILIKNARSPINLEKFYFGSIEYKVKGYLEKNIEAASWMQNVTDVNFIVVKNDSQIEKIQNEFRNMVKDKSSQSVERFLIPSDYYAFNLKDAKKNEKKIYNMLEELEENINTRNFELAENTEDTFTYLDSLSKKEEYKDVNSVTGSFLFIGIMISTIFLVTQIVIMYYKQISEAYEDKSKFSIMTKIGLKEKEIKSSINSQILLIFFSPLLVASIHTFAAYPFIEKILKLFQLSNTSIFMYAMISTFVIFSVIYGIIYKLSSNQYYKIIKEENL